MNDPQLLSYRGEMFVDRDSIRQSLATRLFDIHSVRNARRSIIVEGPGARGKTWLLEHLNRQFKEQNAKLKAREESLGNQGQPYTPRLVLLMRSRQFQGIKREVELNQLALLFLGELESQIDRKHKPSRGTITTDDLQKLVSDFTAHLLRDPNKPIVILLLDGMEEIVEQTPTDARIDVLYTFERNFLAPLLKYPQARLLASRRTKSTAYWKTLTIKPLTEIEELRLLDDGGHQEPREDIPVEQQFNALRDMLRPDSKSTFEDLCQEIEYYTWSNPGANTLLIQSFLREGSITDKALNETIDVLLRSPTREPLAREHRNLLVTLIDKLGNETNEPVPLRRLNDLLGLSPNNAERNKFVRVLQEHGIGVVERYHIRFTPEIIELVRAERKRHQPTDGAMDHDNQERVDG